MNEDREIRLHSIMDQYGVDEETADMMVMEEEEEMEMERKSQCRVY